MTPKQQRFVEEYLIDLNATQAAIRAGYSAKTANSVGCENLTKPDIFEAIQAAQSKRSERTEITQDRVLAEYARIAFSNMADYAKFGSAGVTLLDMGEMTPSQTAAISEVSETKSDTGGSIKFKLHDKMRALDALAKHLGMGASKSPDVQPPANTPTPSQPLTDSEGEMLLHQLGQPVSLANH